MQNDNILDLDEFDIKNKIGKGGFAVVYTVTKKSTNEIFAAKILQNAIDDISCDQMLSISHEVNIMSKLNHPSILKFYGYSPVNFENQKNPIILTEFAPNGDLKHIIQLERQSMAVSGWDDTKKLIIIYGIASGMSYLHKNDIIHRDLKPENILMDNLLFPKISDFGLSKITQSGNNQTMQSNANVKGTPIYIAPEIWETQKYGKEGDVYSFSLILYEIMTNEVPFKDIFSISQVYVNIVVKGKRPDFTFPVPNSYRQLIEKCWSYDPRDRPTFDQIITQLKNDEGFITDSVDREDYRNYIDYIEQYQASFDQDKKILKMKEIESSGKKTFQLVTIDQPPLKVTEEDETVEVENNVDDSRKEVKDEDEENNFVSIDKGEDEETAESLFERGKKHYFEALRYMMMAKRKGCQKSSEFLKMHFKDQPDFDEHESESSAQPIPKQYKFEAEKQQNKEEVNKEELNKEELNKEELNKEELNKEELNKEELNKEELNKEELNKEELNKDEVNKEEVNKEEVNKEEVNKEEVNKEEVNKEEVNKEEVNKEEVNKEELNKEELNKEELNKEELNIEELNKEELNKEELNKEELNKEELNKEELNKEELNIEELNKEELNKEELNIEELNKEELNKEEVNKEELNKEEVNKEEVNKEELNKEELNKEELNKEEVNKEELNKEEVNKEEVNKEELNKEELNKEELNKEESNKEELNKEEVNKEELNKEEVNKEELNKDEVNKEELNKEELNKEEVNKEEVNKEELNKEDLIKDEVIKEEPNIEKINKDEERKDENGFSQFFSSLKSKIKLPKKDIKFLSSSSQDLHEAFINELKKRLQEHPPVSGRHRAILLCTGSFCPVHNGHLRLLNTAAKFLSEEHKIDSLFGILSPSSDDYVLYRLGSQAIPLQHRYETLKLACAENNKDVSNLFIMPDLWEGSQPKFVDFPEVREHFVSVVKRKFWKEKVDVLYVCGGDLFMKIQCYKMKGYVGIARPGFDINIPGRIRDGVYACNDRKYTGCYSDATMAIKMAKENGESIKGLTYDTVADYLHDVVHWI
ncbi:hypothetical protein M9Y10_017528 [Tritrichomonas musculus]|uniref:Protein kinase domain-containing protein n=1 Tax=Tritrichomonas musculus TaxID=1915356 RepID=A0ABR2HTU1_9EUKA